MASSGTHTWLKPTSDRALPDHADADEREFQRIKAVVHQQLVESLDLSRIANINDQRLWNHVRMLSNDVCELHSHALGTIERERLLEELMAELFGLGPLEGLMHDDTVTDILVNDPYTVYVERKGRLELTDVVFADEHHLMRIIQRIVARLGRRVDEVSPMVDARLPDGSRVHAIVPPLALDGPALSIRRFGKKPLEIGDLIDHGSIVPEMVLFLKSIVEARIGCLISGGTGAGKTTMLNAVSQFIPALERLVTIEDSAELILQHKHSVRLETRPPNTEGAGEVTQRELVRNSLRMRPDRIIVGEVRGTEVWDMLQAMNTGHEGSLTTIHANSAFDALARLEMMVAMIGFDVPVDVVRQYIASAIRLVVHLSRLKGGPRRVMQISEIQGVTSDGYQLRDIFAFEQVGLDDDGVAYGDFHVTGHVPDCLDRLKAFGINFPGDFFQKKKIDLP